MNVDQRSKASFHPLALFLSGGVRALRRKSGPTPIFTSGEYPLDCSFQAQTLRQTGKAQMRPRDCYDSTSPAAIALTVIGSAQSYRRVSSDSEQRVFGSEISRGIAKLISLQNPDGRLRYSVSGSPQNENQKFASAMAQGLFISAFRQARSLDKVDEDVFLLRTAAAADHMRRPTQEGGCTYYDSAWTSLEGSQGTQPLRILSESIFAILGLLDSPRASDQQFAFTVAQDLSRHLGSWDLGWWSAYDAISGRPASPSNHSLHIELMGAMHLRFPGFAFDVAEESFRRYASNPISSSRAKILGWSMGATQSCEGRL